MHDMNRSTSSVRLNNKAAAAAAASALNHPGEQQQQQQHHHHQLHHEGEGGNQQQHRGSFSHSGTMISLHHMGGSPPGPQQQQQHRHQQQQHPQSPGHYGTHHRDRQSRFRQQESDYGGISSVAATQPLLPHSPGPPSRPGPSQMTQPHPRALPPSHPLRPHPQAVQHPYPQLSLQQMECRKNLHKMLGISPSDIDKYSRIFFPISFISFNLMYWIIYLHISDEIAEDLVMLNPN